MKDISLEGIFQKMHQNDFVEKEVINVNRLLENMVGISKDDKAFWTTLEGLTTKSGDHYVASLPFKKDNLIMPYNRNQRMQRLIYLKQRFNRDPAFFEDYRQFMNNLFLKGYTRRRWFTSWKNVVISHISHHGVYHTIKPIRIRVMFDCSA